MAETASRRGSAAIADIMPTLLAPNTYERNSDSLSESDPSGAAPVRDHGGLDAMAQRPDSISLLPSIACPTTVIVGELDIATPLADAALLADRIPAAQLWSYPRPHICRTWNSRTPLIR